MTPQQIQANKPDGATAYGNGYNTKSGIVYFKFTDCTYYWDGFKWIYHSPTHDRYLIDYTPL